MYSCSTSCFCFSPAGGLRGCGGPGVPGGEQRGWLAPAVPPGGCGWPSPVGGLVLPPGHALAAQRGTCLPGVTGGPCHAHPVPAPTTQGRASALSGSGREPRPALGGRRGRRSQGTPAWGAGTLLGTSVSLLSKFRQLLSPLTYNVCHAREQGAVQTDWFKMSRTVTKRLTRSCCPREKAVPCFPTPSILCC